MNVLPYFFFVWMLTHGCLDVDTRLRLSFFCSAVYLNGLVKDVSVSFFSIVAQEANEQYRRCFTGQPGKSQDIGCTNFCAFGLGMSCGI